MCKYRAGRFGNSNRHKKPSTENLACHLRHNVHLGLVSNMEREKARKEKAKRKLDS